MFSSKKSASSANRSSLQLNKGSSSKSKIPSYFMCPITLELMEDPTITPCGHMFDRAAILKWLKDESNRGACPLCHSKIAEPALAPCFPLKAAIAEFKSKKSNLESASESGNLISTINKKIGSLSIFGKSSEVKNEKEPLELEIPKTSVRKRPKADVSAAIGVPKGGKNTAPANASSPNGSQDSVRAMKKSGSKPKIAIWARLTPILDNNFESMEIGSEEYSMGRGKNCDIVIDASEISSTHCVIYRVQKENSLEYDYFVEDKSTNGTFVNGSRVGKGLIANIVDGDEISLGERFSSKLIPKVASFIDWVFNATELTPERKSDVERIKRVSDFFDLLSMDDTAFRNMGVRSEFVRSRITAALSNWQEKYRFPAYRIEIINARKIQSLALSQPTSKTSSRSKFSSPNINGEELAEINFDPPEYIERDSAGVIVMNVRRSKGLNGCLTALVKTSDNSPTKPGTFYQPFQKQITFADREFEAVVEFFWKADTLTTGNAVIKFDLTITGGKAYVGMCSSANLTIEMSSRRLVTKPRILEKPKSAPDVRPRSEGSGKSSSGDEMRDFNSSQNAAFEPDLAKLESFRNVVDDELLATMMDAFPDVDPKEILEVIRKERKMIAPLDDRNLLQDMVAVKLTNMQRTGDQLDLTTSNIKMMKLCQSEDEEPQKEEEEDFAPPVSSPRIPESVPAALPLAPANPHPQPLVPKFRQTILRFELESFLMMASLSLIRKFFTIQGIDCNISHFPSPVVSLSSGLTDSFLKTIETLQPIESGANAIDDLFEFDKIVELFKKYVYQRGSELRSKAGTIDRTLASTGFRYDIAFRKSAHHFKMENNHAIIEDLNGFAKLPKEYSQTSFYGVFDGHGGYLVSEYLSLHLAATIAKHPLFNKNIAEAIKQGYFIADENVMRKIKRDKLKGGSTSVTAFLRDNVVHVAWAGDARCLVFRRMGANLVAFPLITPHNPQGSEKTRIVKAGGFVEFIAGKWRVNGRLAVTRSFGDENLKPVVTSEPEYTKFQLMGDEEFLMLSCDGLYDVMDYSDVAEHLDESIKKGLKLGQLSASLVNEGVVRKSTDDITVMLINLSRSPSL